MRIVNWSSAVIVAVVGFAVVFVVLTVWMVAIQFTGAVLSRMSQKKAEEKQ